LDPNERCALPLPRSDGLQQWWPRSCSDEVSKVVNSIIDGCDTHFTKPLIFFVCLHFKPSYWVLIKGWPYLSQDQKVRNKLLGLYVWKNHQNLQKLNLLQNHYWKTSICTKLKAEKRTQNPLILIKELSFHQSMFELIINPSKTL